MAQEFKSNKKGRSAGAAVAGYVAKYVGKEVEGAPPRSHSYEVAQGFAPEVVELECDGPASEVMRLIVDTFMGGVVPGFVWSSEDIEDWCGPPVRVAFW